ncbi:hypothetical protein EI77_02197 [Prosthecobacter fusiformis]|uniref:Uncharacterized protein n=1 Tax=Prosthecobacter fusiformis TaxID=48464 RepID=A0A4R7S091_9BACT|nr:hypothetical protein [Prosthecobacter fusiformis]TDU71079.1 hypothetical protein EI77_02197 [Prosthecobacter fusiformis]
MQLPPSPLNFLLLLITLSLPLAPHAAAQSGASPSQNAAFIRELRARVPALSPTPDPLGTDREKLEAGREYAYPEYFSESIAAARRSENDYSDYVGQYQTGRSYFSPWVRGYEAPAKQENGASKWSLGTAMQWEAEYNSQTLGGGDLWILSSYLLLDGTYQIDASQKLTLAGGIGVNLLTEEREYISDSLATELGLTVLPGTSLTYDLDLGDVHVTLYDRPSLRTNLSTPIFQNDLGIAINWAFRPQWDWTLNYTLTTVRRLSTQRGNDFLGVDFGANTDATRHTINSTVIHQISQSWSAGFEVSYINDDTSDDFWPLRSLMQGWNAGFLTVWEINTRSSLNLAAGYQKLDFDRPDYINGWLPSLGAILSLAPPIYLSAQDVSKPYYSLTYTAKINDRIGHEFAMGFESNLDPYANANSSHYVNYGVTAQVWRGGQLTVSSYAENSHADDEGNGGGLNYESEMSRYGIDLHLSQQITPAVTVGAGYSYRQQTVDNHGDFAEEIQPAVNNPRLHQQGLGANVSYAISSNMQVRLDYQMLATDGSDFNGISPGQTSTQHRVAVSLRLQF